VLEVVERGQASDSRGMYKEGETAVRRPSYQRSRVLVQFVHVAEISKGAKVERRMKMSRYKKVEDKVRKCIVVEQASNADAQSIIGRTGRESRES